MSSASFISDAKVKDDALKSFAEIPYPPQEPPKTVNNRPVHHPYHERQEKVAGGDILWKPIDRQAAQLLSSSPWYCKALESPKFMNRSTKEVFDAKPSGRLETRRVLGPNGHVEEMISQNDVVPLAVEETERRHAEAVKRIEDLRKRSSDAMDAIQYAVNQSSDLFDRLMPDLNAKLETLRQTRFAIEQEGRLIMAQFKDTRQFFLDDKYETEIERMASFVALCRELQSLKQSGFLDAIVDTILKL